MSLRARMGLAAGMAVAMAVIAVAVSAYEGTRTDLIGQLNSSLKTLSKPFITRAASLPPSGTGDGDSRDAPSSPGSPPSILDLSVGDCDGSLGLDIAPPGTFGGPTGYVQLVRRGGQVCLPTSEKVAVPVSASVKRLAGSGSGQFFTDAHIGSTSVRVLVSGVGSRGALMVALPLTDIQHTLSRELVLLVIIAAAGIALAALLGLAVARTALAPIARFTRQTEAIARRPDRIEEQRVEVHGSDELARLGRTFNATLDALAESVRAQRNLVADASHELRTPISSIRANLQLMRDEQLLSQADREDLRRDVIAELDELTALVSDVVELARGGTSATEPGELRLDEIVAEAVARARRRAPQLVFEPELEPTLVSGDGERIARVVSNLLDNAAKWSPEGEAVHVALRGGVLVVRDHGPGFDEDDLPFVFDRFYRSRRARSKPGSGLGLAIVRQAAEAHGGFVEATNAPGGGALLRVSFGPPLVLQDPQRQAPVKAQTGS